MTIALITCLSITISSADNTAIEFSSNTTLADLLEYAQHHNPGLISEQEQIEAAGERVSSAGALPDPVLTYGHFITPVETRLGPQERKFSLMQKLPWLQKLSLKRKAARQSVTLAELKKEHRRQDLFYRIKTAFFELRYLLNAERLTAENIVLFDQLTHVVRAAYGGGNASQAAMLRIQIEIEMLKTSREQLIDMRNAQTGRINALLSRDIDTPIHINEEISSSPASMAVIESDHLSQTASELQALLTANNPGLNMTRTKLDLAQTKVNLAGKSYFPDLSLGVHFIQTGDAIDPSMPDSGRDPLLATVSFGLPIWPGNHSAVKEEAKHLRAAARSAQKDRQNELFAELEAARAIWLSAKRQVALYRDNIIPLAQQAYEVTAAAFAADQVSYTDLIEAQRSLLMTRLTMWRAITDLESSQAKLELLIGSAEF